MGAGPTQVRSNTRVTISEINVTPLVDVMLVLLIIFMVTAPMMQQGLQVELPETRPSGVQTTEDPLVLVINSKGQLTIGEAKITTDGLEQRLAAIFATRKNREIYIQADKAVNYGVVAEVMAEIKASGATGISLITLPK